MAQSSRTYPVDLPEETTRDRADVSVVAELRVLWVIEAVRKGRISTGCGARVLGMPLARFLREASAYGLAVLDAEPGEVEAEVGSRT